MVFSSQSYLKAKSGLPPRPGLCTISLERDPTLLAERGLK